ncbi:FAD/NAD(P)-binding domain-containing protein [Dichomitus squalens]|uniref:FAD/NAD(P)-binding domain-containing protein n=1 Tax=Dichomitus squalens TaxID=114155 RepID=A0A4Q9PY56_9APHY|nr:FAD/NAD(P)-binding domain-containing protein [Dichomitus squalens]
MSAIPSPAALSLDFVVVGGAGIGGLAVAYVLSKGGQRVRVLEKNTLNVPSGGHRMTPNSSKILRQWIGEEELMKSAVRCVRCKTFDLRTGEVVGYIEWKPAVMAETGGDLLLIHHNDLVRILHRLATDAGAIVDFNAEVTSVRQGTEEDPKPIVTLATGEVITADVLVGADGGKSLVRKVVFKEEDCAEFVRMTLYTGTIDAEDMVTDPDLAPYILSDEWAVGMSPVPTNFVHAPLVQAARTQYAIHLSCWETSDGLPQGGEESWEELCSIDSISTDTYGPAFQKMAKLTTNLIRTQWKNHENTEEWVDSTGRMVLLGDAAHPSHPGGIHSTSMAIEDAVVLGSLFSHLSMIDQVPSFLSAYQELRQRRCELLMAAGISNARTVALPDGPLAEKRNADMRARNVDWDEGTLKAQFEEIAEIFAYDAGDAAEEWWVNWGRFSAAAREQPRTMNIFWDHQVSSMTQRAGV